MKALVFIIFIFMVGFICIGFLGIAAMPDSTAHQLLGIGETGTQVGQQYTQQYAQGNGELMATAGCVPVGILAIIVFIVFLALGSNNNQQE